MEKLANESVRTIYKGEEVRLRGSPEQHKIAQSRRLNIRPLPPDDVIGTEVTVQTEGEKLPEVSFTPTETDGWEVVEKKKKKRPRVKTQRVIVVERTVVNQQEDNPVQELSAFRPPTSGVPSSGVLLYLLCRPPRIMKMSAATRKEVARKMCLV